MPVLSFVDSPARLVITLCIGQVTPKDISATFSEIRSHPGFHPDFRQLSDLSLASSIPLRFPDLYHLQQACDPFSNQGKRAVVAPDPVPFGLSRMYQLIVNNPNFEVFHSLPDALNFLEWDGAVLEGVIRDLLAQKNISVPEKSPVQPVAEKPAIEFVEFINRLKKATSA
jgi:hypothetical protein